MKRIFFSIALILFSFSVADASPAYPYPIKVTQPDGSVLTIRVHGDEYLNWVTCGNSLVTKGADGYYRYASFGSDGLTKAQGAIVRSSLSGDGSAVKPPKDAVAAAVQKRQKAEKLKKTNAVSGSGPFLVMLIQFQDLSFQGGDNAARTAFDDMMNQSGYSSNRGTGSVRDYFTDNSHGRFTPKFDVVGPITVSGNMEDYSADDGETQNGAPRLLAEACQLADAQVNFANYDHDGDGVIDNVFFYYAGYNSAEGAEGTIWPHAWQVNTTVILDNKRLRSYSCSSELRGDSGADMAGIGTFCHEFAHSIGLPDFYDTDYEENGSGLALSKLSLMSYGNYNNEGRTPPYLNYEERHILGWDTGLTLLEEGLDTLFPISGNNAYYCPAGRDGEYYLFESRPVEGWDASLSTAGMAVYHVDKSDFVLPDGTTAASKWLNGYEINIFADHQCMDLVETVTPESNIRYYSELLFPGSHNVTELNAGTDPALVAWNGMPTGYSLSDIRFKSRTGASYVRVGIDRQVCGVALALDGTPLSGVEITVAPVETQLTSVSGRATGGELQLCAPVRKVGTRESRAVTGEDGTFVIPISASGDYSVSARKDGYMQYSATVSVDVAVNITITLPSFQEQARTELKKYSEVSVYSLGNSGYVGYDWYAGARFLDGELVEYVGFDITSVSFKALNGGSGTVQEMGVKVFFDNEEVLSRAVSVPVFNTMCTVDISDAHLTVPEGKSVLFAYYLLGSSHDYPLPLADLNSPVTNGNLWKVYNSGTTFDVNNLQNCQFGNFVISATVVNNMAVIGLAGINMIHVESSGYEAGDTFELRLDQSASNPPSSVTWHVNGEAVSANQITLSAGAYVIRADLTYSSGRQECVETRILVR